ncbi:MAG: hypothetical protein SGJ11_18035 [Phycisphaerae bacterium]|nr:hypothetical protein [Phycisphaerae bacterium]
MHHALPVIPLASYASPSLGRVAMGAVAALAPARLIVAFVTLLVLVLAGRAVDLLHFTAGHQPIRVDAVDPESPWGGAVWTADTGTEFVGPASAMASGLIASINALVQGLWHVSPSEMLTVLADGFGRVPAAVISVAPWTSALWLAAFMMIASVGGGGLARMTALEAGRGEKLTSRQAALWLRGAGPHLILVPLAPAALVAATAIVVVLLGVTVRLLYGIPVLNIVGGLLYGLVLAGSLAIVVTGGAALLGWPWSIAAAACGDADPLDATVRSTSYIMRHPLRAVALAATSVAAFAAGISVVGFVAWMTLRLAAWTVGEFPRAAGGTQGTTLSLIEMWEWLVFAAVLAYAFSCAIDLATRGYMYLRFVCDGQDPTALDGVPLGRPAPVTPPTSV